MRNFGAQTVNEKVVVHLGDYSKFADHFVVPFSATQDGIAEAIGIARPHVSRAIKELKEDDLVFEKKARVERSDRKRKVYFLTNKGVKELKLLKENLTYHMAIASNIPLTPDFIGRTSELKKMKAWTHSGSKVLVVQGVLGIGKTSLVSKFVTGSIKNKIIFWHSVKETDTVRDILSTLGNVLYMKNNGLLRYYLLSNVNIDNNKIINIINKNVSNAILILDDCEKMGKELIRFMSKMVSMLDDMDDVKMVLITGNDSQILPKLSHDEAISKLKLTGLEKNDTQRLLKGRTFSDDIYKFTNGHPLFLKLIDHEHEHQGDVRTYLKRHTKGNLTKEEKKIMEVASVHRGPFKAKALFVEAGTDYETMMRLINKSLLTEVSNDLFVVHEFIKEDFYGSMTEARKRNLHRKTAEYFLEEVDSADIVEAIHHYVVSNKFDKAANTAISHGISLIEKGHYTEFDRALEEIEEGKIDEPKQAEILILRGHLQKVKGNWDEALANYRAALTIFEKHNMIERMADAHRLIGAIYKDKGDYSDALDKFNHALDLMKKSEGEVVAKIYDDIGTVKLRKREIDEAEKAILKGVEIANKIGNEKQAGINNFTLGNLYLGRGEWDKAKRTYRKSADTFERVQNLRMLAVCHNNLAIAYFRTGDVKKAIDHWEKGLSISEKIGDIKVMFSYVNLGFITFKKGEWTQTEKYCMKALAISENIDNALISSSAYSILGHMNVNKRNFPACIEYYEKALKLRGKEGDISKTIASKNDLAYAYLIDGQAKKAKKLTEMALDMASNTENKEECARAHLNLGNYLIQMQKIKDAKDSFSNALKLSNQIKSRSLTGKIYFSIGELYIKEKEYLAAERHLTDSVHIFEELEEYYELALSLIHLARSYKESGTEDPDPYFKRGKEILYSLNAEKVLDFSL